MSSSLHATAHRNRAGQRTTPASQRVPQRPAQPTSWALALSYVGPNAQPRVWETLSPADRAQLLNQAPQLHHTIVTDVLDRADRPELVALAARSDLDYDTLTTLADSLDSRVQDTLAANPTAGVLLPTSDTVSPGPMTLKQAEMMAALRPIPPTVFSTLARDKRTSVRKTLVANPTLTAADLATVLTHASADPAAGPSADLARAAVDHPAANLELRSRILSGLGFPACQVVPDTLIHSLLKDDPLTWVPVILHTELPDLAGHAAAYLSLLTPLGQARLVWSLTRTDQAADRYLRQVYDADLDPRVARLVGGWINANGRTPMRVDDVEDGLRDLIADLAQNGTAGTAQPEVAAVVADTATTEILISEIRGTAWGRHPFHLAAATRLPWQDVLAQLRKMTRAPDGLLELLATRPHAPAELGHLLLTWAPALLINAPHVTREHVTAAISNPGRTRTPQLLAFLTWALPTFDITLDELADVVDPVADLFDLLDNTAATSGGVAWATRTTRQIADRVAVLVRDDPSRVRLLAAAGGLTHPGTLTSMLDLVEALSDDLTPG